MNVYQKPFDKLYFRCFGFATLNKKNTTQCAMTPYAWHSPKKTSNKANLPFDALLNSSVYLLYRNWVLPTMPKRP